MSTYRLQQHSLGIDEIYAEGILNSMGRANTRWRLFKDESAKLEDWKEGWGVGWGVGWGEQDDSQYRGSKEYRLTIV